MLVIRLHLSRCILMLEGYLVTVATPSNSPAYDRDRFKTWDISKDDLHRDVLLD
jgi:hypothetical protein